MSKQSDNIFGIAGHQPSKRPARTTPAPVAQPVIPHKAMDPDIEDALKKVQQMHDDLENKVQMVYSRLGVNKETSKRTLDNPKNYEHAPVTYEDAQQQRRLLRNQVIQMVGEAPVRAKEEREQQKDLDRHKKKSLGSRKNWLNMR